MTTQISFNLIIEILIVDSNRAQTQNSSHRLVSISELRFLSLIEPTVSDVGKGLPSLLLSGLFSLLC